MDSPPPETIPHQSQHHHHHHQPRVTPQTPPSPPPPSPPPLLPPISFSMVLPNIYRSGYPLEINHPFLSLLRLRTIIYLSDTIPLESTFLWASTHSPEPITIYHFPLKAVKEPFIENDRLGMKHALEVLLDERKHPVLIHSNKGKHRAGVLVACLRKLLMGWGLAATFAEYGRYAGEKGEADLEFIELFNPELKFEKRYAPAWLRADYKEIEWGLPDELGMRDGTVGHICSLEWHAHPRPPAQ